MSTEIYQVLSNVKILEKFGKLTTYKIHESILAASTIFMNLLLKIEFMVLLNYYGPSKRRLISKISKYERM